jgi:hypothetical protein
MRWKMQVVFLEDGGSGTVRSERSFMLISAARAARLSLLTLRHIDRCEASHDQPSHPHMTSDLVQPLPLQSAHFVTDQFIN